MRRTNSSSHIPLPRSNLFGHGQSGSTVGLRRAQSVSRLSQNNEPASLAKKPQRTSSLERKSSTARLSKLTPLTKSGRGNTPVLISSSQRNYSSRVTQSESSLKERKTIQKLSSDKRWVADQFKKVQNFINTSQLFDTSMVTSDNIKPPSIKTFIYMTSVLFREIFPNVQLTNQNYKEVIPNKLKILQYPGTIPVSTLKTVNTMHSWPQVIGMFGWLIDKINLANEPNNFSLENLDDEERQKYLLGKNAMDLLVTRYLIFNNNQNDPEEIEIAHINYVKNITHILEFDTEEYARIEKDMLQHQEHKKILEAEVENLSSEEQKLALQVHKIKAELRQSKESDDKEEEELDAELQSLQKAIERTKAKKSSSEKNIAQLRETMKSQPCTYKEKVELLKRIDALKNKRDIVKGKIEHAQRIKCDFDAKLNVEQCKLQSQVLEWNKFLMEMSIKKPQLKKLLLKETGFHKPEFLHEIEEVSRLKIEIENDTSQRLTNIEIELKEKTARLKRIETEIESLERLVTDANEQIQRRTEEQMIIENNIDKKKKQWEEQKAVFLQELNDPQKIEKLKKLSEKESQLRITMEVLEKDVKNLGKKVVCFFIDLQKQVKRNISEMEGMMKNVEDNLEQKVLEATRNCHQIEEVFKLWKNLENEG